MNKSLNQNRTNSKFSCNRGIGTSSENKSQDWQQERQDRIAALVKQLEEGVASIQSSDDFKRWLKVASRFHSYSVNNQLLILFQFPTAARVAGYRTWQSLGRQVKKGSKGINILAPRPYERVIEDRDGGTEEIVRGISFRTVSVFDISQTEGAELPSIAPDQLHGEDGEVLYQRLDDLAEGEGLKVTHYDLQGEGAEADPNYNGYYLPGSKLIYVKRAAQVQMVKTLAHELGHHFDAGREGSPRDERETVAFVVGAYYGIDTTAYTFPYVAGWAAKREGAEIIKGVMTRIQQTSHRMLALLEGDQEAGPRDVTEADQV
jgi:antirestriction protein ArdC